MSAAATRPAPQPDSRTRLLDAAMQVIRAQGYSATTVDDICRAAGVSRALFYFYFPAKEDVLFEVGLLSTRAAQRTAQTLLRTDYDVESVIAEALRSLERSMARNPRDLIIETILEGYRHELRILMSRYRHPARLQNVGIHVAAVRGRATDRRSGRW